jgi:CPA1 family monovalent cation:H+ antiporter
VLAVLALGLYLRTYGHAATTSQGWLLGRAVWSYADFLITSLVFAVLGFELVKVIDSTTVTRHALVLGALVVTTLVVVRAAWVFASAWLARGQARRHDVPWPAGWRESAVVSWAGMRGVVTVAAALALPESVDSGAAFPFRDQIVVVALLTVLVTLVLQGLTLAPLTSRLGVGRQDDDSHEVAALRRRAAQAALDQLHGDLLEGVDEEVARAATLQYEGYLSAQDAMEGARRSRTDDGRETGEQLRDVLRQATDVERALVLEARRRGQVSPASADEVLRDIEGRVTRDFG